jgi:hypothetical protein
MKKRIKYKNIVYIVLCFGGFAYRSARGGIVQLRDLPDLSIRFTNPFGEFWCKAMRVF